MSIHIASIVWRTELGGPSVKAVAMKLADCADDDGTNVFPSRRRLARETETVERTVDKAIDKLVELKVLVLVEKGGKGPGHTSAYRFDLDVLWQLRTATERKWKEEDDKIKSAKFAPLRRTKRREQPNKPETKGKNEGAEIAGAKGANFTSLSSKGAIGAEKGANSAEKGAAAAPNPSLPVIDPSHTARDARQGACGVSDLDLKAGANLPDVTSVEPSQDSKPMIEISKEARAEARRIVPGRDIASLESEWREWSGSRDEPVHNPDAAFLAFCQKKPKPKGSVAYRGTPVDPNAKLPEELVPEHDELMVFPSGANWGHWLTYTEGIDRAAADRMRGAMVVFVMSRYPASGSPIPRIPDKEKVRASQPRTRNSPASACTLRPKDPEWAPWIEHLKATDRDDLVCEARDSGSLTVPTRRPPTSASQKDKAA